MTLSDFISNSHAEKDADGYWIVFQDGEKRQGAYTVSQSCSEFEAKENFWHYLERIKELIELKRNGKQQRLS
jgi:hypothetical protein